MDVFWNEKFQYQILPTLIYSHIYTVHVMIIVMLSSLRLLDLGFEKDVSTILQSVKDKIPSAARCQTVLMSATLNKGLSITLLLYNIYKNIQHKWHTISYYTLWLGELLENKVKSF